MFRFNHPPYASKVRPLLRTLPLLAGEAIRIERVPGLRDRHGTVHAGAFLRERRIAFDCRPSEFVRIFVHELFHFVWLRLGNVQRQSYEAILRREISEHARGELGWSAEWRKGALRGSDVRSRSRRWREYCCESFCDSAAWRYSGITRHVEFSLAARFRRRRAQWFADLTANGQLSI